MSASETLPAVPVLELEYGGGQPALAAPTATWWQDSLEEASVWWTQSSGFPVTTANLGCTNLHLLATTSIRPDGRPLGRVAGRWQGASHELQASCSALSARWPGLLFEVEAGELRMSAEGLVVPAPTTRPGWRATIHLAGVATEVEALIGTRRDEEATLQIARLIKLLPLRVVGEVDPQGRASLTLNLPQGLLVAPDPAIAARLPTEAALTAIVAVDGSQAIHVPWIEAVATACECTRDELASGLSGTWAAVVHDDRNFLLVVPATPLTQRLIAEAAPDLISEDWQGVRLIATSSDLITSWKLAGGQGLVQDGLGMIQCDAGRLIPMLESMDQLGWLNPLLLSHWPLPQRLLGNAGVGGAQFAKELNQSGVRQADFPAIKGDCAASGIHRLSFKRSAEGFLRLDLDGSLLPWVLPGLVMRWFADIAEDQEGRIALRTTIAELGAAKAGALPDDLLAGLPEIDATALDASIMAWKALEVDGSLLQGPRKLELAEQGLPSRHSLDPQTRVIINGIIEAAAHLPDLPGSTASLREVQRQGKLSGWMVGGAIHTEGARSLARAGRLLATYGDVGGLDACELAITRCGSILLLNDVFLRLSLGSLREDAYLFAILRIGTANTRFQAWVDEPWTDQIGQGLRGERLLNVGSIAQELLDPETVPGSAGDELMPALVSEAICTTRMQRAWTARDLASIMLIMRDWELGREPAPPATPIRSLLAGMILPSLQVIQSSASMGQIRHSLMRLGGRVVFLAQRGPLPADAATLAVEIGHPLELPFGLAVAYERRGERGFRLAVDVSRVRPEAISERTWQSWQKAVPSPVGTRLALPQSRHQELVWEPPVAEGAGF